MEAIFEVGEHATETRRLQFVVVLVLLSNSSVETTGFQASELQCSTKSNVTMPTVFFTQSTPEQCWEECTARAACRAFNFYNLKKLCELDILGDWTDTYTSQTFVESGVVHWAKTEFPIITPCGPDRNWPCFFGQTCDKNSGTCGTKECGPLIVSDGVVVRGNMNTIGSKVRLDCKEGYVPSFTTNIVECGVDGQWTINDVTCKRCDTGWTMFHSSCYKLFSQSTSWDDAKTRCEQANASLASITGQEENTFINAKLLLVTSKLNVWIGASDIENEGTWKWVSGEDWAYECFATREPGGSDTENCLGIGNDNWWYSLPCNDHKNDYLCEKQIWYAPNNILTLPFPP